MQPSELPTEDLLLQLNEESGELVQATAKYLRKLRGNNPTPISDAKCIAALIEEIADVQLASEVLLKRMDFSPGVLDIIKQTKKARWHGRLSQS